MNDVLPNAHDEPQSFARNIIQAVNWEDESGGKIWRDSPMGTSATNNFNGWN